MAAVLISAEQARARVVGGRAQLLVIGEGEPRTALPQEASFVRARAFREASTRDVVSLAALEHLFARCGVEFGGPVVLADATNGPHAALAFWTLAFRGHESLALVDGGWPAWEKRAAHPAHPLGPSVRSLASPARATRADVARFVRDDASTFVDVRSPAEFAGMLTAPADAPQEGILRGGHLPGAINVPWVQALRPDGFFRSHGDGTASYCDVYGLAWDQPLVVYSRTAARACHTWFALTQSFGFEAVRVYDGGWAEWGNLVAAPVERGA